MVACWIAIAVVNFSRAAEFGVGDESVRDVPRAALPETARPWDAAAPRTPIRPAPTSVDPAKAPAAHVVDETADRDVVGNERRGADGRHVVADTLVQVAEGEEIDLCGFGAEAVA